MIRCITGTVIEHSEGAVVLDVNGLGYLVHVTADWYPRTDIETLWTHLAVRETSLDLYGFTSRKQCSLFEHLLTIPKIGPKSALQILNKASYELLLQTIREQDPSGLAKRSGITPKTAEKIIQELQDSPVLEAEPSAPPVDNVDDEVIATLIALGYPERAAYDTVRTVLQEQPTDTDTQTLIRAALKKLSKH